MDGDTDGDTDGDRAPAGAALLPHVAHRSIAVRVRVACPVSPAEGPLWGKPGGQRGRGPGHPQKQSHFALNEGHFDTTPQWLVRRVRNEWSQVQSDAEMLLLPALLWGPESPAWKVCARVQSLHPATMAGRGVPSVAGTQGAGLSPRSSSFQVPLETNTEASPSLAFQPVLTLGSSGHLHFTLSEAACCPRLLGTELSPLEEAVRSAWTPTSDTALLPGGTGPPVASAFLIADLRVCPQEPPSSQHGPPQPQSAPQQFCCSPRWTERTPG